MLTAFALIGVLVIGFAIGLLWRGAVLLGDRTALERLVAERQTEQRLQALTHATLTAMRQAVREHYRGRRLP